MPRRVALLTAALSAVALFVLLVASGSEPSHGQGFAEPYLSELFAADLPVAADPPEETPAEKRAEALALHLPTSNDALLRDAPGSFFQDLNATVPGLRPFRWMGGQYGFVRNVARTPAGQTFTRLHQGVDIRPVYRNRNGVPLDTIRAIDQGTVVYVNRNASASNYGRYVVVRHEWEGTPVYSLLAHLESVWVPQGAEVAGGAPIGRMGYTGRGLDRNRAHVHLEIALLLNHEYQRWHDARFSGRNHHNIFNGQNLRGVDPAELFLAQHREPGLTFAEFVRRQPVGFRIALPGNRPLDILKHYPWLALEGVTPADVQSPGAWVIGFTREGVPVEISRQARPVEAPRVVYVADEIQRRHLSTGGLLSRGQSGYDLTQSGRAYAALLATGPDGVPRWF